jgi:hypothetical protein
MGTPHYVVFVGPSASLEEELRSLEPSNKVKVIAIAATKPNRGITSRSIQDALAALKDALARDGRHREESRLSLWAYKPWDQESFRELWVQFGRSAWIELIPRQLNNQNRPTRLYIQNRLPVVEPMIHEVALAVYTRRHTSPLPLPLNNFRSKVLGELTQYWYTDLTVDLFRRQIERTHQLFREGHTNHSDHKHYDDRSLAFSPAANTECHGQSHPIGSCDRCFVSGRFRFGAALYPGFHYDVSSSGGTLNCTLYDCEGVERIMGPEKRKYINVFPNDHLLPQK